MCSLHHTDEFEVRVGLHQQISNEALLFAMVMSGRPRIILYVFETAALVKIREAELENRHD